MFAIDRAGRGSKCGIVLGQILETNLFAVDSWPAPATLRGRREICDRVALGASYKLVPVGE
jgi:hypothetical protein